MKGAVLFLCFTVLTLYGARAQDISVLSLNDFDLKGQVKSCTVINNYGKEVFEFDEEGRLTRSRTQYSENDTHWVTYVYSKGYLKEKRSEHYLNGELDREQSIINLYQIDTLDTGVRITEKIVSYNKAFLEQIVYQLNEDGQTVSIQKLHADAVDEIKVKRSKTKSGQITEYVLNGALQKWIRERLVEDKGKGQIKEILTREYFNEEPYLATEVKYSAEGMLLSSEQLLYDDTVDKYITEEKHEYIYGDNNLLKGEKITSLRTSTEKSFVFQYDNNTPSNWIRKIILPDNSYTSRVIEYFSAENEEKSTKGK
jgi:hypothetical protein